MTPSHPTEKRALGHAMRLAEKQGMIAPPAALRAAVEKSGLTDTEIDTGFDLFVTADGSTLGGTLTPDQLDDHTLHLLARSGLIEQHHDRWQLTSKGEQISTLLTAYADPTHHWRSLLHNRQHADRP